jgi:hypothetical protein
VSGADRATIVTVAPGQRLAYLDDFVLVHLATVPVAALARAISEHGVTWGTPSRLGLLYWVERSAVRVPPAETRDAFVELSRTSEPFYAASTVVVPGGGMAAATANTFVQGVRAISGGRLPMAIFGTAPLALGWLRQSVPKVTKLPSDDAIEELIARVRALSDAASRAG